MKCTGKRHEVLAQIMDGGLQHGPDYSGEFVCSDCRTIVLRVREGERFLYTRERCAMDDEKVEEWKRKIDGLSQTEMASLWRYAPVGHIYFDKSLPLNAYFKKRFEELGGFTTEVSKAIDER